MYKVVILDDEPWSRTVVKSLGEWDRLKLQVVGEAEDGEEGIRLITELQPQIVITDMRMPGLQGVELLQELTLHFPSLKVLIMSGYNDFVYLKQAIRSRAVEYLLKPINPEELNEALARCAAGLEEEEHLAAQQIGLPLTANPVLWNEYLEFRQRIHNMLQEMNKPLILDALAKLHAWFKQRQQADSGPTAWFVPMGHDLLSMLEVFATAHGLEWKEAGARHWAGIPEMFEDVAQLYTANLEAVDHSRRNKGKLDIEEVKAYIERNYMDPISLETIAQHFFVVKEHLSRTFKSLVGENITDYLVRIRMEKARELIAVQNVSIKTAAAMAGYTDVAYFYRVFKKHFGIPPGELKRDQASK